MWSLIFGDLKKLFNCTVAESRDDKWISAVVEDKYCHIRAGA